MVEITFNQDFKDSFSISYFVNNSFNVIESVLKNNLGVKSVRVRGLYQSKCLSLSKYYATFFNENCYAELDYTLSPISHNLTIKLFGIDKDKLSLIKEDINKSLKEFIQ